jgi:gamma-glutamyl:cysteine ligase YbdK (ATP-grasp superfamily)
MSNKMKARRDGVDDKIEDILAKASPAAKKELLDKVVSALLKDLNETGKKDVLRSVLEGRKSAGQFGGEIIDMVDR